MVSPSTYPLMGQPPTRAGGARRDSPMFSFLSPQGAPFIDLAVLHELEQQINDRSTVLAFVHDFVDLWESRYGRLVQSLKVSDPDAALDALLSIKTSSAMAGALRLSQEAKALEDTVKSGDHRAANGALPNLQACGQQTVRELCDRYIKQLEQG